MLVVGSIFTADINIPLIHRAICSGNGDGSRPSKRKKLSRCLQKVVSFWLHLADCNCI
jgi:hypothetical protein